MPRRRLTQIELKRNEAKIHRKGWETRWRERGRHIETPLSEIKDPKERTRKEAEIRAQLISAEMEIEKLRAEHYANRQRPPKGYQTDEERQAFRDRVHDPIAGSGEEVIGRAVVSEAQLRASLMEDLPFYAMHGHFSDEPAEGVTSSGKQKKGSSVEELNALKPGSFRNTFSRLNPREQANFRARAAAYLDYEHRLSGLQKTGQISTGEMVVGYATDADKARGGHLLSESARRKLSKKEKKDLEEIADRASKTTYRDVEPGDLPYLSEHRAPQIKKVLKRLLADPTKTQHARLNQPEAERRIEKAVDQELGSRYEKDPTRKADKEELVRTLKQANFGMSKEDRAQLLEHTRHELEQHYIRAQLPAATREDRRRFEQTQKRYKGIKLGVSPEVVHAKHVAEQAYVQANLPDASDIERERSRKAQEEYIRLRDSDPFSEDKVKTQAKEKAVQLIRRLSVDAETDYEANKQAQVIRELMKSTHQITYTKAKKGGVSEKQLQEAARVAHETAIRQGFRSPVVEDLTKEKGRAPSREELAEALGIKDIREKKNPEGKVVQEALSAVDILGKIETLHAPRVSFDDPRTLGRETVEQTYRRYGHADRGLLQGWLKRESTPEDYKRALSGGKAGRTGAIQWIPPTLKTQFAFHKQQQLNRLEGAVSGNAAWGVQDGKRVSINKRNVDKVAFGVIPNRQFNYELENQELTEGGERKKPLKFTVPGYDLRDIREIAPGNRYSEKDIATPVDETRLQTTRFNYARGAREPVNPRQKSKTPFVAETFYVPVIGATGQTHTTPDPKGGMEEAYFELLPRHTSSPGRIGPQEGSGWGTSREIRVTKDRYDALPKDAKDTRNIKKSVQYVFMDPGQLALKEREIDKASILIPGKDISKRKINLMIGDRLGFVNLPGQDTRRDKVFRPYFEARAQRQYEERAVKAADLLPRLQAAYPPATRTDLEFGYVPEVQKRIDRIYQPANIRESSADYMKHDVAGPAPVLTGRVLKDAIIEQHDIGRANTLKQEGFNHQAEIELLAAAAGASAFYKIQKSAKKGILHKSFEKGFGAIERTKLYQSKKEPWSLPEFKSDITRAYISPGDAFLLNKVEQIKHPLSSQTSSTIGGLDIETPYFRKHGINPETRELRQIQRESSRLHDIVRAQDYGLDHINDTGLVGAWRRHRAKGYMRHNIVKNFNRIEDLDQGVTSTVGEATRFAHMYKDNDFVLQSHPANHSGETFHVTTTMKTASDKLLEDIKQLREHSYVRQGLGATVHAPHGPHFPSRLMHGDISHTERNLLIGGAVAGTALGAAYLYHRHQEKKKEEADRIAFYNKALPPAFNVPLPHLRANAWVNTGNSAIMREIPHAANRKIPVRFGVSLKDHRIAMRPMDRPAELDTKYAPNLPIGIAGFRPAVRPRGGSLAKSLTTDLHTPLKRSYQKDTHELVVGGRRIGFTLEKPQKIALSRTNPNKLDNKGREEIINAAINTPDEAAIRRYYSYGKVDPIIEMWNDPEEVSRIRKQKGTSDLQKIAMKEMRRAQAPTPRSRRREKAKMGQTGRYY